MSLRYRHGQHLYGRDRKWFGNGQKQRGGAPLANHTRHIEHLMTVAG